MDGDRRLTWGAFDDEVARLASVLSGRSVSRGDRVALVLANSLENLLIQTAVLRLGAIVVPVNTRLAVPEIAHVLDDCEPLLVVADAAHTDQVSAAVAELGRAPARCDDVGLRADAAGAAATTVVAARESDDAFITYTSGTTGRPKGVLIDHHRAVWAALAQVLSMGLRDGERYLHLSPLYHSGGVVYANVVTMLAGTHVVERGFDPARTIGMIERERITTFLGVPTMYQQLLRQPGLSGRDLSSWRTGIFGAAPMPARAVERMLAVFPHVALFQLCGQTEAGPVGLYSTTAQIRERPDSTGHQTQPGLEMRVVTSDGLDAAPGESGEMLFRGESVMKGYWRNPEATVDAVRDGWLHTGDVVRRDPDGALVLVDRLRDVIITGGQNVYSAEVEAAVARHRAVRECAVVARPHQEYGSTVVAVVALEDGARLTLEELRSHCAPLIAHYKVPRALYVAELPRNAAGKVRKDLVRAFVGERA